MYVCIYYIYNSCLYVCICIYIIYINYDMTELQESDMVCHAHQSGVMGCESLPFDFPKDRSWEYPLVNSGLSHHFSYDFHGHWKGYPLVNSPNNTMERSTSFDSKSLGKSTNFRLGHGFQFAFFVGLPGRKKDVHFESPKILERGHQPEARKMARGMDWSCFPVTPANKGMLPSGYVKIAIENCHL